MSTTATGRLLLLTLAVASGIWAADYFPAAPSWLPGALYAVAVGFLALAGVAGARSARRGAEGPALVPLCCAALCFAGIGAARTLQAQRPGPGDVSQWAGEAPRWVQVRVEGWADADETGRQSFTGRADAVREPERLIGVQGTLHVLCPAQIAVSPGAVLWLHGQIALPRGATNPGAFDYARYLGRQGTFALLIVRHPEDARSGGAAQATIAERAALWVRDGIHRAVAANLRGDDAALMNGLLLSDRTRLPAAFTDHLQQVGMIHILSVSGLHVAVLAGSVVLLLRSLRVPRAPRAVAALLMLWLFVLASGCAPAAVRSGVMASLFLLAPLVRRTSNAPHTLLVATLLLLLWTPGNLWDAGFQLSVATVGSLVLYAPLLTRLLLPQDSAHAALQTPVARHAQRGADWVLVGLLTGLIAEAGSAPLVVYHFNLLSPVGPFANLGVVAAEVLTLAGLALSCLQFLPSGLLSLLWYLTALMLHVLQAWVSAWAALPFASVAVSSPPVSLLILYYAMLPLGAALLRRHVLKRTLFAPLPPVASAPAPHAGLPAP